MNTVNQAYLRFPIENVTRRWLLAVVSRQDDRSAPQGVIKDRQIVIGDWRVPRMSM